MTNQNLTPCMHAMLAMFAAEFSTVHILHDVKNGVRTLNALVSRDLVAFVPDGRMFGNAVVGEYRITEAGRDVAWKHLLSQVAA